MSNKVRSYTAGYVPGESHVDEENEDLSARKPRATTTLFEARPGGYMQQYGTPLSAAFSPSPFLRRPGDPPIKMGFLAATINLAKVMAGAGMLSLPSGMAAGRGTGYAASALALAAAAAAGGYTFFSLGVCLRYTRTASFKDLLIVTLGPWSGWCIDVIIVALGFSLGLLYVDFVGDLFSSVLASFSWIPDWVASRDVVIIVASICFLGPLSLAKERQDSENHGPQDRTPQ